MKQTIVLTVAFLFLLSCTELYEPDINNREQILVIDAFIGNTAGNSYVNLSLSLPFDSLGIPQKISSALVYVTDNQNIKTTFKSSSPGIYLPENNSFKGVTDKTYILTVETDNQVYQSSPQKMLSPLNPVKVSGGYNRYSYLYDNGNGKVTPREEDVCEIYFDFKSTPGDLPRFRFTSAQIVEYTITKGMMNEMTFFCWFTTDDRSLRFTSEKYPSSSGEIKNQVVCVTDADGKIIVTDMNLQKRGYGDTVVTIHEHKRIIRINQYRLNPDSYLWYKGVEKQSSSEGKVFDPLPSQLSGNITCKTEPARDVLGFFEVSPVTTRSWVVYRGGPGIPVRMESVPNIYPPFQGFTINYPPGFWIN